MAIYHFSAQVIGRSAGRSAVAAAAYRAAEQITDQRTGLTHDFTRRRGDIEAQILAPGTAPAWVYDRAALWNQVEAAEKRSDAQVAREINVALPRELSRDQQRELALNFVQEQFVARGMVADLAIHHDTNNPHIHVMLTMREIGPDGFGKKVREWNDKNLLVTWREEWARYANRALERIGQQERIDHRSLKAQGETERLPQVHIGPHVSAMERQGIRTDRGDKLRFVRQYNGVVIDLQAARAERAALQAALAKIRAEQPDPQQRTLTTPPIPVPAEVQVSRIVAAIERLSRQAVEIRQLAGWADSSKEQDRNLAEAARIEQAQLLPLLRRLEHLAPDHPLVVEHTGLSQQSAKREEPNPRNLPAYVKAEVHLGREIRPGELPQLIGGVRGQLLEARAKMGEIQTDGERLEHAALALSLRDRLAERVQSMERPTEFIKRAFSREARARYQDARDELQRAEANLRKFGVQDSHDHQAQRQRWQVRSQELPALNQRAYELQRSLTILSVALQALQQLLTQGRVQNREERKGKEIERGFERG